MPTDLDISAVTVPLPATARSRGARCGPAWRRSTASAIRCRPGGPALARGVRHPACPGEPAGRPGALADRPRRHRRAHAGRPDGRGPRPARGSRGHDLLTPGQQAPGRDAARRTRAAGASGVRRRTPLRSRTAVMSSARRCTRRAEGGSRRRRGSGGPPGGTTGCPSGRRGRAWSSVRGGCGPCRRRRGAGWVSRSIPEVSHR